MNKTIYLPDDEAETWEKARRLANDRLSPVILKALKEFIMKKEAETAEDAGFERIEVAFDDSDDNNLPKRKAFRGKWILPPKAPFPPDEVIEELGATKRLYTVAVTSKGNIVVYTWVRTNDFPTDQLFNYKFLVFQSWEEAARDPEINGAIREAVRKRGVPVEELDI